MNRISNLPPGIIESILCFLPIEEAVKTSILSREWRYRWMKIPKLVFKEFKFHVRTDKAELTDVAESSDGTESSDGAASSDGSESSDGAESSDGEQRFGQPSKKKLERLTERRKFFYAICQVLLMHEGPLHEFSVSMFPDELCFIDDKCAEMDAIIFHLSRKNTVKKLAINFAYGTYMLPSSIFSFRHLTDLSLAGCCFFHRPTFSGSGSLTSLSLDSVYISKEILLHLLSNCPLLKTLTLVTGFFISSDNPTVPTIGDSPTIINLFECLLVIESLSVPFGIFQFFESCVHHIAPRELPITLAYLKYVYLDKVCFTRKDGLSVLVLLMKISPNLETLKIESSGPEEDSSSAEGDSLPEEDIHSFTLEDYSDIWLEHMRELHIGEFKNWGNELNFVKLILAKSPALKKVRIFPDYTEVDEGEKLQILQVLLSSPCASPVVKIIV